MEAPSVPRPAAGVDKRRRGPSEWYNRDARGRRVSNAGDRETHIGRPGASLNDQSAFPMGPISTGTIFGGRYRILDLIGDGSMGAVYRVEETDSHEILAIKVLHPDWGRHPEIIARFERDTPDLMLVDIQLPRKSGFELLQEIKARPDGKATPIVLILLAASSLVGCGAAEQIQEPTTPPPMPSPKEEVMRMEFKSKTDTIDVMQTGRPESAGIPGRESEIRFMVQIGAFRTPPLAAAVQTLARNRYHMPVLNDFVLKAGLYQIRIGFFETRAAANAFRAKMQKEYPEEYKDAWVVQLRR